MPALRPGPYFGKPPALAKYREPVAYGTDALGVNYTPSGGIVVGGRGTTSSNTYGPGAGGRVAAAPQRRVQAP